MGWNSWKFNRWKDCPSDLKIYFTFHAQNEVKHCRSVFWFSFILVWWTQILTCLQQNKGLSFDKEVHPLWLYMYLHSHILIEGRSKSRSLYTFGTVNKSVFGVLIVQVPRIVRILIIYVYNIEGTITC